MQTKNVGHVSPQLKRKPFSDELMKNYEAFPICFFFCIPNLWSSVYDYFSLTMLLQFDLEASLKLD